VQPAPSMVTSDPATAAEVLRTLHERGIRTRWEEFDGLVRISWSEGLEEPALLGPPQRRDGRPLPKSCGRCWAPALRGEGLCIWHSASERAAEIRAFVVAHCAMVGSRPKRAEARP
jgi:hypothetical protein